MPVLPAVRLPRALVRRVVAERSGRIFDASVPIDRQRRRVDAGLRFPPPPRGTRVTTASYGGVTCHVVTCGEPEPGRTIVHLHGGGFVVGSARGYRPFAARLARATRSQVVLPDYRLAPEHPFPAAVDDSIAVWQALVADPGRTLVLSGDSAGGNLALVACLAARDAGRPPAAAVLMSPAVDLSNDLIGEERPGLDEVMLDAAWGDWAVDQYAGDHDRTDPRLSPLLTDLSGLPPLLVLATAEEMLAADADRLSERARAAGVDVMDVRARGMWHVYPLQAGIVAEADHALARIAAFVAAHATGRTGADVR